MSIHLKIFGLILTIMLANIFFYLFNNDQETEENIPAQTQQQTIGTGQVLEGENTNGNE